jgi:hypothetical protein
MSAKRALFNYHNRLIDEHRIGARKNRHNKTPERDLEKLIRSALRDMGFSCNKVESKAVYSESSGAYRRGMTTAGMSDYIGVAPGGYAAFIEVKAPGQRCRLKEHQRVFLVEKINFGAFAVCVDSVELLASLWKRWSFHRDIDTNTSREILLRALPPEPKARDFVIE